MKPYFKNFFVLALTLGALNSYSVMADSDKAIQSAQDAYHHLARAQDNPFFRGGPQQSACFSIGALLSEKDLMKNSAKVTTNYPISIVKETAPAISATRDVPGVPAKRKTITKNIGYTSEYPVISDPTFKAIAAFCNPTLTGSFTHYRIGALNALCNYLKTEDKNADCQNNWEPGRNSLEVRKSQ